MSIVLTRPLTIEEFEALPYEQTERMEVVRGVITPKDPVDRAGHPMSPGAQHGAVQLEVAALLRNWARARKAGFVGVEVAYLLGSDPLTVRIPDVSFLGASHRPVGEVPEGAWQVPPTLAVEVISPSELAYEVREKVSLYLASGVAMVWTIFPSSRMVVVDKPDGAGHTYRDDELFEFPDILPGFSCKVAEFFVQEE